MRRPIKPSLQILAVELATLGLLMLATWLIEPESVRSVFAGGLVYIIPSAYFTLATLPQIGARESQQFLVAFMRGHTGKVVLAAAGFAIAFRIAESLHTASFFITYCVLMLIHTIAAAKLLHSSVEAN